MEKYGYIYMTTNNINGMRYIGKHKNHVFNPNYKGSGNLIKLDVLKYGKENFTVELLEWCNSEDSLNEKEKFWIKYYNAVESDSFYNISHGGIDSFTNLHHSEESKQHMSESHKKLADDKFKETMRNIKLETNKRKGKAFWINDGSNEYLVVQSEYENHLKNNPNIIKGRLPDTVYMNKDGKSIKISKDSINEYLKQGYSIGKDDSIINNIRKSRQHEKWIYNNMAFDTAKDLTEYLKNNGYPEIVKSTVVNIGSGKIVNKYISLCGNIIRQHID